MFKGVAKLAKSALGSVSKFRSVLNFNPALTSFAFPPQVQLGINAAKALGLKLPSQLDLLTNPKGTLNDLLGSDKRLSFITKTRASLLKVLTTVEEKLNSIDWLRG